MVRLRYLALTDHVVYVGVQRFDLLERDGPGKTWFG
jgi:hypothetical protein